MGESTRWKVVDALIRLGVMIPGLLVLLLLDNNASSGSELVVIVGVVVYLAASQYAVTKWRSRSATTG
jgi:hypothetical protein